MKGKSVTCLKAILILQLAFFAFLAQAQQTQIKVTNIKSSKGKIIINIFNNENSYEKQETYKKFAFEKKNVIKGTLILTCDLQPGIYGITLVDDENENGTLDKSFFGMPKEGFGFSNFYMEKLKKPSFDDFKVNLNQSVNKVEVKVKYM
jgi:uncharacterized protein (DUF2141 family)